MVPAAAQLGVEGVEHVGVECPDLELAEVGRDVLADVRAVEGERGSTSATTGAARIGAAR